MTLKSRFGVGLAAVACLAVVVAAVIATVAPHDGLAGIAMALTPLPAALPRDIVSLQALRSTAYTEMEAALGLADDVRQAEFDGAEANVKALDIAIANAERLRQLKGNGATGTEQSENLTNDPAKAAQGFMAKYRNLPASAHLVQAGHALSVAQMHAFGDMLMAVRRAALNRGMDDRLVSIEAAAQGANEAVGEDAGFLVEKDVADGLLRRTFELARIGSRARRIPISARSNGIKLNALKDNSRATGSRWGGVQGYWIGEGEAMTPSRPKFRQMNLQLKKLAGLLYATDEVLADAPALAAVMAEAFPEEFAFMVDDAIFEGSGAAQPLGFMNAGCKVSVSKETGQAAATILFENVTKMHARMPARSIPNAEWWINQDTMPALMGLHQVIGTGGVPVYLPPGGLSASPYGTLLGRPVMPIEYCSTLGTEGDIVFADPTNYVMIDKGDIQYATSIHVAFLTNEQAFRFIYRVDGQPVDDKPITPFKGTATQSTFVTLATRG